MSQATTTTTTRKHHHLRILLVLSVLVRLAVWTLVSISAYLLPLFDASPTTWTSNNSSNNTSPNSWASSSSVLLRWDAFHFTHIALKGYVYEHQWAFFDGVPLLMRSSAHLQALVGFRSNDWTSLLTGGACIAAVLCDSTQVLYHLSLHHLHSPSLAFLSAALSIFSSSPVALRMASYSEPFFTYLSYRGMLASARSQWPAASLYFALASCFRSNGIFLSGFIFWGMLITPFLTGRRDLLTPTRIFKCVLFTAFPLLPFIRHNVLAYRLFCTPSTSTRIPVPDWCMSSFMPSIYSHVQAKYWHVGFLRYWTISNIPNFILASPALLHVFAFCQFYLLNLPSIVSQIRSKTNNNNNNNNNHDDGTTSPSSFPNNKLNDSPSPSPFLSPSLLPHVLHASALAFILTTNAHVQISLRLLPSLPLTYWAAARLMLDRPRWGNAWVAWSVMWGALSCVLWAVFLPPA